VTQDEVKAGRIAFREEGSHWNAYYAMPDTMKDAIWIGSIAIGCVTNKPHRKREFMTLMRNVVADLMEETGGPRPIWRDPETAPEHERTRKT
jgi:hypothetical protein